MPTRDETRQELKNLARLAAAMPKESLASESSNVGLSASRVTVPPAIASVPAPPGVTSRPPSFFGALTSDRAAGQPLSRGAAFLSFIASPTSGWRGAWAVIGGGTLAAAMVAGLLVGQALTTQSGAPSSPMERARTAGTEGTENFAIPAVTPTPTAAPPAPTETAAAIAVVPPPGSDNAFTVRAPRPVHHVEPRPLAKSAGPGVPPTSNTPPGRATSPTTKLPPPRPAAHDSLDDLIRKAAAGN